MTKLLIILLIGLTFESAGVVLLKTGLSHIGGLRAPTAGEVGRVIRAGARDPAILLGIFFEALFFACLLVLMSRSDISFLWPLTGLSFVFATFAAMWFLHERVSVLRWIGVVFIMVGAAFISYSEHTKDNTALPPTAAGPKANR